MRKKFIVCTQSNSAQNEISLRNELDRLGLNWWHWLPNTWLIIDDNGNLHITTLRDTVVRILGPINSLVIEVSDNDIWCGYGENNKFNWINTYWQKNQNPPTIPYQG